MQACQAGRQVGVSECTINQHKMKPIIYFLIEPAFGGNAWR